MLKFTLMDFTYTNNAKEETAAELIGTNWFFYWKISSSLWKERLMNLKLTGPIFIPLNWAHHSDTGDTYDFASIRPETNLKKLEQIIKELGKKAVFLFPLTPLPFLPNGGIPPLLARTVSTTETSLAQLVLDANNSIHKIYSYFDPKIYKAYRKFIFHFTEYLNSFGLESDCLGLNCGYLQNGIFHSYLEDHSKMFDSGLTKFLSLDETQSIQNEKEEFEHKTNFTTEIKNLYLTSAEEVLRDHWAGTINVSLLGGIPTSDLVRRSIQSTPTQAEYIEESLQIMTLGVTPSPILLNTNRPSDIMARFMYDLENSNDLYSIISSNSLEDESATLLSPLVFFEIYNKQIWAEQGLIDYLSQNYKWSYRYKNIDELSDIEECFMERIYFFNATDINLVNFGHLLSIFMNTGKIILDIANISSEIKKKLEIFFLENSLQIEKINYLGPITYARLGEGTIITIDGNSLKKLSLNKRISFWANLDKTMSINHLKIEEDSAVYYYWRTRQPSAGELNYEEVRRVSIYNPTNYKKKVRIPSNKNFALIKIIDEINTKIKSSPIETVIELMPMASVSLDFGFFE